MTKYVFILGGVVSSLGKGIASASIGALLSARGYKVRMRKMDPYLNIDPGAMSPLQHGEVFVTDDGAETDLDLGHYERFSGISCRKTDTVSGGKIFNRVLTKERQGYYSSATIQMIPHVTDEIKLFMNSDLDNEDFVLYEVGGTVGDIEGTLFLEAVRQFIHEKGRDNCAVVLLTLLPYIPTAGELKTKPTQHAVKKLLEMGIQADILLCRSPMEIPINERKKLGLFCNVETDDVVAALDVDNIYKIPITYHEQGLDTQVLKHFGMLDTAPKPNLGKWEHICQTMAQSQKEVRIGIVGKYCALPDAYKSLIESLTHAGIANEALIKKIWIDCHQLEQMDEDEFNRTMDGLDGILVPGGFGEAGVLGKIRAIKYARENKIPFFGVCLGMQLAVIEACQNLLNIPEAYSTEFNPDCVPVVHQVNPEARLGAYQCLISPNTKAHQIYQKDIICERHRNLYEVNSKYEKELAEKGFIISAKSVEDQLPEIIEIPNHPFFVASLFHPDLKSKPFDPAPLIVAFIKACI